MNQGNNSHHSKKAASPLPYLPIRLRKAAAKTRELFPHVNSGNKAYSLGHTRAKHVRDRFQLCLEVDLTDCTETVTTVISTCYAVPKMQTMLCNRQLITRYRLGMGLHTLIDLQGTLPLWHHVLLIRNRAASVTQAAIPAPVPGTVRCWDASGPALPHSRSPCEWPQITAGAGTAPRGDGPHATHAWNHCLGFGVSLSP